MSDSSLPHYHSIRSAKHLLILLLLCFSFSALQAAPGGRITGKVQDEQSMTVPYAAVVVYTASDSSMVTGTTTDDEGQFEIAVDNGSYFLKVSFLSYEDLIVPDIAVKGGRVDLGLLRLSVATKYLDEVVINAERSQMELRLDKKVFNVGKDLSSTGGSASDILDRVPSVNVDVEGNVSLRGSQNVRILIDGKPSGLVSNGDPQSLRQLQGNLIESIEVITNPSAKFDAEGEAGIINIVLKELTKKGVNGSFDLSTGWPHDHGAAVNLNYRNKWFNIFVSEGISYERGPGNGRSFQEYFYPDTTYAYERLRKQTRGDLSNNFRLGADFYATPKDIITISGLYQYATGKNLSTTTYIDFNGLNQETGTIERYQDEYEYEHEVEADLSYKKEFDKKDQELTMNIKFNLSQDVEEAEYEQDDLSTASDVDVLQRSDNLEYQKTWLFQADYNHPFGKKGNIETGGKASLRNLQNDFLVEEQDSAGNFAALDRFNNEFVYLEKIYALYISAGEQWGNFSAKAGLRMEYSDITTELVKTEEINPRQYVDFFPSVFMGYKIRDKNTLQFSYSRRISRPNFWSLLPFFQYADTRNYWSGNPDLNPEYTHSFELGYQRYLEKGSLLTSVYYRYRTGVIERITFVEESGDITRTFPVNLATANDYGFELSLNYDFYDWWNATSTVNAYRSQTKGFYEGTDFGSDTYAMDLKVSTKFTVAKRLDLQTSFRYDSPRKTSQGTRKSSYALDFGTSLDVLKKKGTVTLSVQDIFNTRVRRWTDEGENFRITGNFQWRTARSVKLSFNYRLGE